MDRISEFLELLRQKNFVAGRLRGVLHVAIGRTVARTDGTVVSTGLTWRELATLLKTLRFDRQLVREVGADPDELSPRDRQRMWYAAIALARVDSAEARLQADQIAALVQPLGYVIGPPPQSKGSHPPPRRRLESSPGLEPDDPKKKKKK